MKVSNFLRIVAVLPLWLTFGCKDSDSVVLSKEGRNAFIQVDGAIKVTVSDSSNIVDVSIYNNGDMIFSIGLEKGRREPDSVMRFLEAKNGDVFLLKYDEEGEVEKRVNLSRRNGMNPEDMNLQANQ